MNMNDYMIVDGEEMKFIWDTISSQQIILHPDISPDGKMDAHKFWEYKRKKKFLLFLDRNILSSLLKFCENGYLKNKGESQRIGLIMAWSMLNGIPISAGLAIQERASQLRSQEDGLSELQKFLEIFDYYSSSMWVEVATGRATEIPPITYSQTLAQNITVNYADSGEHYEMALASILHVVWLYRNKEMSAREKMQEFLGWTYDNLLVSEYLLVYAAMLFTEQESIKAPKQANADMLEKIVAGCENQAWDIAYLTEWSTLYSYPEKYEEEFLFATNDILLKRIFMNKNVPFGFNGLLHTVFSQKEYDQIMDYIESRVRNRIKPNFGPEPHVYFQRLIEAEKQRILNSLNTNEK